MQATADPTTGIRIVLVETSHPGNIGAAARAMRNMGLSELVLVRPSIFPDPEATARASGADELLESARVVLDLDQALVGCHLVFGTTARERYVAVDAVAPRLAAAEAVPAAAAGQGVALVFGRERSGLTNEELDRCNRLIRIPTAGEHSSLNLAMAVMVLAYELRLVASDAPQAQPAPGSRGDGGEGVPVPADEMERLYDHLQQVMLASGFLDPDNPRHLMRRLRRLFARAAPDRNEVNILRGILSAVEGRMGDPEQRGDG